MKYSSSLKLNHIFRRLYHTKGVADGLLVLYARKNHLEVNRVGTSISTSLTGRAFLVAQLVKNPPVIQDTWVQSLG